jgi:hypothetical protein
VALSIPVTAIGYNLQYKEQLVVTDHPYNA